MTIKKLPPNYWETIKKHYPNFDRCKDILEHDVLNKYVKGDLISINDLNWVKSLENDAEIELQDLKVKLYTKAMSFYRQRDLN